MNDRRWHEYEYRKREWLDRNPGASPEAITAAFRRIAKRLGL